MVTTMSKWGNSLSVRIPMAFIRELKLSENSNIDVSVEDGKLVIVPVKANVRKKIEDRFADFERSGGIIESEAEWGNRAGDEVW